MPCLPKNGPRQYNTLVTQAATESEIPVLTDLAQRVDADLAGRIEQLDLPENLLDALRYACLSGGKRLRPVLTLLSCKALGGSPETAFPAAAALEMIHCFSLVHDDLPALDDDDMRRGRPALHIHSTEAMAILTGDIMISIGFEIIGQSDLPDTQRSLLTFELAHATTAMITGQVYDTIGGFGSEISESDRLALIHRNKTGALIRGACRLGAICGKADSEQLGALTDFGETIGLMFQIVDDLLDVTQSSEHIGKATGKDQSAGKLTFPGLFGIDASRQKILTLQTHALESIKPLGPPAAPLGELCNYLAIRTR